MNNKKMDKKEVLKKMVSDFGIYTISRKLEIEYDCLVDKNNHQDKVHDKGLDILLANSDLKKHLLDWVFAFEANGLMTTQHYFITNPTKAYDQLLLIAEDEKEINKIFQHSSKLLCKTEQSYQEYIENYVKFLGIVIKQSKNVEQVEKMFIDFTNIKKMDKVDLFPILSSFLDKKISADRIYNSIKGLNNAYLETKLVDYLYENNIKFSFELKRVDMYDSQEKLIYEHHINFNANYFMKLGVQENKVKESLEVLFDLMCQDCDLDYLIKKKDKTLKLILRSEKEDIVKTLSEDIKQHSALVVEFVQKYDDSEEYKTKFMIYWNLNKQFQNKGKNSRHKI